MPLKLRLLLVAFVGCTVADRSLSFGEPNLVAGEHDGGGPWWDKVHSLSDTHHLGWAEDHMIASTDGGKTWKKGGGVLPDPNFPFHDNCTYCAGIAKTFGAIYTSTHPQVFHGLGNFTDPKPNGSNITNMGSLATTTFYIDADGNFARNQSGPASVSGLPHLVKFSPGSGGSVKLADGSMVATSNSILSTGRLGYLSVVSLRSEDNGFTWKYSSIVAQAADGPWHEGPSENAVGLLANGSVICVMRVEGQSGRYSPYISKVSDDGGRSWHSLRSLPQGVGCVRPRMIKLDGSLVLSGGRPSPLSRDVLVWLNEAADGVEWKRYSISYWHNRLVKNQSWLFPPGDTNNSGSFPRLTTSYTSLCPTGGTSAFVLYGMGVRAFAIPITLTGPEPTPAPPTPPTPPTPPVPTPPPTPTGSIPYNPAAGHAASIPSTDLALDLQLMGGASTKCKGFKDKSCPSGINIRTGNPGQTGTVVMSHAITGFGHKLASVSLSFRYIAGFSNTSAAATVQVVLLDAATLKPAAPALWTSKPLGAYQYAPFAGFSPPILVDVAGLNVSTDTPIKLAIAVTNNGRNLQLPMDVGGFNASVAWQ